MLNKEPFTISTTMEKQLIHSAVMIKAPEDKIDPNNPWKDDKLGRKSYAESLTELVKGVSEPLIIGIDGDWGTGKTFLLKRWQIDLLNAVNNKDSSIKDISAIYFNAWEDDFLRDPFVAVVGQIWHLLKNKDERWKNIKESFKKFSISYGKRLGMKVLNKIIERKLGVNISDIASISEEDLQYISTSTFDQYHEEVELREKLKNTLTNLAEKISEKTGRPFIFIIDELDRCRPTYAIEFLEKVKHLFSVPNTVFVVGFARTQLEKSIKTVYGEIDVTNYLHRFFDFEFHLPDVDRREFISYLCQKYGIIENKDDDVNFKEVLIDISVWHKLSLRELEQCIKCCALTLKKDTTMSWPIITVILILLKIKKRELYLEFTNMSVSPATISDFIIPKTVDLDSDIGASANLLDAFIYSAYTKGPTYSVMKAEVSKIINNLSNNESSPHISRVMKQLIESGKLEDQKKLILDLSHQWWNIERVIGKIDLIYSDRH